MSDDRIKDSFRRIVSETPDAPAFSELETYQAGPPQRIVFKPWMVAVGASLLVMVVVGAVGLLGGGGPDVAGSGLIDYVKIEYSSTVDAVCEGGEIIENGGFDEATIEIWGPNEDDLTLMVATFPDGSTERTILEGQPTNPEIAWVEARLRDDPASTKFRFVDCDDIGAGGSRFVLGGNDWFVFAQPFLGPPPGFETYGEALAADVEAHPSEWNGNAVLLYEIRQQFSSGSDATDVYVTEDDRRALRIHVDRSHEGIGATVFDLSVVDSRRVSAENVAFDKAGLVAVAQGNVDLDSGPICPVTIPSQGFVPPDGYPATPADPGMVWFGKDDLWTMLPADGVYRPRKSVWWSVNFPGGGEEETPEIQVQYQLLNMGRDLTISSEAGTNAYTDDDGWFMIADIDPNASGCWQVTAFYKGASLSYVFYSVEGNDPASLGIVPDVVGMTAQSAGNVLHDAGYEASPVDSDDPSYEVCAQEPGAGQEIDPGAIIGLRTVPPGQCDELMNPVLEFNPNFETYTDGSGRFWYRTDCPAADVLLTGGVGAADGLPLIGQTWQERVEFQLENYGEDFMARQGLARVASVVRNGEVWDRDDEGGVIVSQVADYMVLATIVDELTCPDAPYSWNGIPVAFYIGYTE